MFTTLSLADFPEHCNIKEYGTRTEAFSLSGSTSRRRKVQQLEYYSVQMSIIAGGGEEQCLFEQTLVMDSKSSASAEICNVAVVNVSIEFEDNYFQPVRSSNQNDSGELEAKKMRVALRANSMMNVLQSCTKLFWLSAMRFSAWQYQAS